MCLRRDGLLIIFQIFLNIHLHSSNYLDKPIKNDTLIESEVRNKTVVLVSALQYLWSDGYPESCCQSANYFIISDDLLPRDCIHLAFEDLDLPRNTSLMVLEVADGTTTVLFEHTSQYLPKTSNQEPVNSIYLCESVLTCWSNGSLLVMFRHEGSDSLPYVGFKARTWITSQKPSVSEARSLSPTSNFPAVPCQILSSVSPGEQVIQRIVSTDSILDYVWTIKPTVILLHLEDFLVFLRIISTEFDGDLEVRKGVYSEAVVLMRKSVISSDKSLCDTNFESELGLHVRLRVPPNVTNAHFEFVTGIRRISVPSSEHKNSWIVCHNSSWIVLGQYKCDNVRHCPLGEDEELPDCVGMFPPLQTESSVSFLKWLIPLVGAFLLIGVFFSILKIYLKNKYRHQDRCNGIEMTHPVSPAYLPLLRLPGQMPSGPQPIRSSEFQNPSGPNRHVSFSETPQSSVDRFNAPNMAAMPVPMARSAPISIPIVVRPQVHRDGQVFPPSYEEVMAEHSFGDSSDSLDELEQLPEYHPPSYEDASQGKVGVVSSWVSSSQQPIIQ